MLDWRYIIHLNPKRPTHRHTVHAQLRKSVRARVNACLCAFITVSVHYCRARLQITEVVLPPDCSVIDGGRRCKCARTLALTYMCVCVRRRVCTYGLRWCSRVCSAPCCPWQLELFLDFVRSKSRSYITFV